MHPSQKPGIDAISVTERGSFKLCRRQWLWGKDPISHPATFVNSNLWFGTAVHAGLETYYATGKDLEAAIDAYRGSIDAQVTELATQFPYHMVTSAVDAKYSQGIEMLTNYAEYDQTVTLEHWEIVELEKRHYVPVLGDGRPQLTGQIDMLIRINGDYWVVDHKTYSQKPSAASIATNDQITAYAYLLRESYGIEIRGGILNVLLKKLPSEKVRQKYNWFDTYFCRFQTERSRAQVDAFAARCKIELEEIEHVFQNQRLAYETPGFQCSGCQFQRECLGEITVNYV